MTRLLISANTDWYLYNFRLSLAREARQAGYEVVLVSPPGRYVSDLQEQGFRWVRWGVGRQTLAPWSELGSLLRLLFLYILERPAIVHHHTIKPVLYGSLAAQLTGVPAVVNSITGRGYIFLGEDTKARQLKGMVTPLYRLALGSPRCAVIFENQADQAYFLEQRLVPPERTFLIEGVGVDSERFKPAPEPEGVPLVVLPARMLWDKGVGVLVDAARIMHPRVQVRVALVGEPDSGNPGTVDPGILRQWDAEGVVEWRGWRANMEKVYQESHIVTLPTTYGEGVPTVLLEAAACSRPLVASDTPGCRQVVQDGVNGILVPPNDPQALAEALERLVCDPELRGRMGAAGRELVLQKFTHAQINAATLDVYARLLRSEI